MDNHMEGSVRPGYGPRPGEHYPYPHPPPGPTQNTQPISVSVPTMLGPEPQRLVCPHCNANVITKTENGPTMKTHLIALLLCLIGCCICAPCVYCADSCLATKHYCSNCNNYLGIFSE